MMNRVWHIGILLLGLLAAACSGKEPVAGNADFIGSPVLFTAGDEAPTRAPATPYMAQDGRFVCTMYYHPGANDTDASDFDILENGTATTAWLKVENNVGNSVYRKMDFGETGMNLDVLRFDRNSTIFYWQNRLNHAFLALADYNQLSTNVGATAIADTQGKLKMYPYGEYTDDPAINVYDLTRGDRDSMAEQPDPIQALTIMKPAGATQEANRVRLYFHHQFSQIQVNLKGPADGSADITAGQILSVQLLGVSTEGYVSNRLNANGTVNATRGKEVRQDQFTDEQLTANKWGTSFEMFDMATGSDSDDDGKDDGYAVGFIKSYNAIAFGRLNAIRITWREDTLPEESAVRHVTTFEIRESSLRDLRSGMKYIYDLELRRGTLAIIRTQIIDWKQDEDLVYGTDGTITN